MPPEKILFDKMLEALLNEDVPFHPRHLNQLSDLDAPHLAQVEKIWPQVSLRRRQAILEDIEGLGETDFVSSYDALARMALNDPDALVRTTSVRVLWEYEQPELVPTYFDLLASDPDAGVRAAAATALGRYVYLGEIDELDEDNLHEIVDVLLTVAEGAGAPLIRRKALEALGFSSRAEVIPLIERAYVSDDKEWLTSAIFAMGRSGHERWVEKVTAMLAHAYPTVRAEAARAAGELELHDTLDTLLEFLEDDNEDVRAAAIWSLSDLGGEGVRAALEALQEETEDEEEADYIETALDNLAFNEDFQFFPTFDWPDGKNGSGEEEDEDLLGLVDADLDLDVNLDADLDEDDEELSD